METPFARFEQLRVQTRDRACGLQSVADNEDGGSVGFLSTFSQRLTSSTHFANQPLAVHRRCAIFSRDSTSPIAAYRVLNHHKLRRSFSPLPAIKFTDSCARSQRGHASASHAIADPIKQRKGNQNMESQERRARGVKLARLGLSIALGIALAPAT